MYQNPVGNPTAKAAMRMWANCLSLGVCLLGAANAHSATAPVPRSLYVHANLIDTASGNLLPDMAIGVRDGRIDAVGPAATARPSPDTRVIDLQGKFVIPGLVNSHVHLATSAEPAVARAYLRRELYSGVTTVRDMAGDVRLLAELKREAEFDEIVSPDIYYAALMAGPAFFADPRTHDASRGRVAGEVPWMQAIGPETDLPLAVARARGTGATGLKLYADLSAERIAAITAEAHRQHLQVWAHAAVFPAKPSEVVAAGVDVVSHACLVGFEVSNPPLPAADPKARVDGARVTAPNAAIDAVFADMRERNIVLDATLYPYEFLEVKSCLPVEADSLAAAAQRSGVAMSAGTDDDPIWTHADTELFSELQLLVDKAGMTPAQALRAATLVGAKTVAAESDIGSVSVGKLANFVVLRRNPLLDIRNVRSVDQVIKHGVSHAHSAYRPYRPASTAPASARGPAARPEHQAPAGG